MSLSESQLLDLGTKLKKIYHSLYFAPSVVFVAMLLITFWSWRASVATLNRDIESVITDRTTKLQGELTQRFTMYEQILTGGAGLIKGSGNVLQSEWHNYINTFDIANLYPGLESIGYIKVFTPQEIPELENRMRKQDIDFKVQPAYARDFYTAILYSEPKTSINSVGLDMFVEPNRKSAMIRARDTGKASITPPLDALLPVTDQEVLLIFVPQYANDKALDTPQRRQQALGGYVYARIRSQDFFSNTLTKNNPADNLILRIESKDSNNNWVPFYKTPEYDKLSNSSDYIKREQTIDIFGQTWKLNYSFSASDLLRAQRRNTPAWTILAGVLLALLLSEVVFLLLKSRANELTNLKEEAVDLAKDELLSLASHQLRTPATTVKQYLGMVLQGFAGDITPTQASLLEKAYAGNERQLYIINEMLHVAKIDAGRIVLARHETNINKLLDDIAQETQNGTEEFSHKLTILLPKKPIILNVDEHMLRMAIENIVSNAVKYTLAGGKIKISLKKLKDKVYINVKDSGIGIDQADIEKLYKLFTRLDNPLTQNVSGTGVGLYLAKHLVELHGGKLTVVSQPKKGSTFTITLPSE